MRSAEGEIPAAEMPPPPSAARRSRGLVALVWNTRRPRLFLAGLVLMLFWPTLLQSFAVDDYRNLRLLEDYERGASDRLRLYEFLRGGADNRAQRLAGMVPWWVSDDFRFTYFRPVSEAVLRAEYGLFGRRPLGHHLFSIALYVAGVWLVLALYRDWARDESRARWAAVAFAVAASNAVPAAFIAAQCDLLALLGSVGAVLCATRYVRGGSIGWLIAAIPIYAAGLLSKEAGVPAAVLPLAFAAAAPVEQDERRRLARRAIIATAPLLAMSAALIAYYGIARYGSNGSMLLDPLGHPAEFLWRMPGRAVMLLASWLLPVNPQWFDLYDWLRPWGVVFLLVGSACLAATAIVFVTRHRRDPAVPAFALWALPFMPLLACTNPDNRVMMLPAVGLSMLAAAWMTGGSAANGERRLNRLPAALFVVVPFMFASGTVGTLGQLERQAAASVRAGVEAFQRPAGRNDFVFFLNTYWQFDAIWSQDRADFLNGRGGPRIAYLGHMPDVQPEVLGPQTLRLRARTNPFYSTYPGRLVLTRDTGPPAAGTRYDAGEYTATISEVHDGRVWAVDFEFRQPLDSPHYRFMRLHYWNAPQCWIPAALTTANRPASQ